MTFAVNERQSVRYTFVLLDDEQVPVQLASLATLTLTLYDQRTETVLNSRTAVDIKNANGGTFASTSGQGTFRFTGDDNAILGTDNIETHVALFGATWDSGELHWEVRLRVNNMTKVP